MSERVKVWKYKSMKEWKCESMRGWKCESRKAWMCERVKPFKRASETDHHNQKKVCDDTQNSEAGEGMCNF